MASAWWDPVRTETRGARASIPSPAPQDPVPRIMKRPLLLSGFMATGKSTVGRRLAEREGVPFLDLDALVIERSGRSVVQLFAERGEAGFRALEREALLD